MNTPRACESINTVVHNVTTCVSGALNAVTSSAQHHLAWLAAVAIAVVAIGVSWTERRHHRMYRGARFALIESPPAVDDHAAEALWSNLMGLLRPTWLRIVLGQPHLAFEITASVSGTRIGMWVPAAIPPGLVERAIEAAWPSSRTVVQEVASPLPVGAWATGGELRLALPEHFPLKSDHAKDPLRPLLGALAGIHDGEVAAVQILARPVTGRRRSQSHRAATTLRTGTSTGFFHSVLDFITPGPPPSKTPRDDPTRAGDVRTIIDKAAHPSWEMCIRYGVAVEGDSIAQVAKQRARGHAHAIASAFAVYAGRNGLRRRRLRRPGLALASRSFRHGDLVSVPELAAVAHLPMDVNVPGLRRAGAASVAPSADVARVGKVLGDASTSGGTRPVALAPADARYHVHVMGSTGSGKSTLLTNLVLDDVASGRGAVVIDPKGDLIVDILDRVPQSIADRIVLFDPQERDVIPAMNVLAGEDGDLVVDNLVGIFRRIFEAYWGPRTDDILRAACLTLRSRPGATLVDVPHLLTDASYRKRCIGSIQDHAPFSGFWTWYEALGETQQANVIGPLISKLRAFLMRDFVRSVIQPSTSSFDMAKVLDGGLCLVRIPKGILGEETSRLLGSFVVAKVWQAATARAASGQDARVDASLYIDECQNFLNLPRSFDEMLAEARGYRLSLVLAHQHLTQLPRDLRDAVSANARNKLFFTMSPEDAHALERHVAPHLSEHDLAHLGGYQAATRLIVKGEETPAFTMRPRPAPNSVAGNRDAILVALRDKKRKEAEDAARQAATA